MHRSCSRSIIPAAAALTLAGVMPAWADAGSPSASDVPLSSLPVTTVAGQVIDTGIDPGGSSDVAIGGINATAVGAGRIWFASPNGLASIDLATGQPTLVDQEKGANIVADDADLWRSGYFAHILRHYDPTTGELLGTQAMDDPLGAFMTPGTLWIAAHDHGEVVRLDAHTGAELSRTTVSTPGCCGAGGFTLLGDRLFVSVTKDNTIVELDPATGDVIATHHLSGACDMITAAARSLWTCWREPGVEDPERPVAVERVDPDTWDAQRIAVPGHSGLPGDVDGEAWLPAGDELVHLDARTGQPDRMVRIDGLTDFDGSNLVEAGGAVWISGRADGRVLRVDPATLR